MSIIPLLNMLTTMNITNSMMLHNQYKTNIQKQNKKEYIPKHAKKQTKEELDEIYKNQQLSV